MDFGLQPESGDLTVLHAEEESVPSVLDLVSGKIHTAQLSPAYFLKMLRSDTPAR